MLYYGLSRTVYWNVVATFPFVGLQRVSVCVEGTEWFASLIIFYIFYAISNVGWFVAHNLLLLRDFGPYVAILTCSNYS